MECSICKKLIQDGTMLYKVENEPFCHTCYEKKFIKPQIDLSEVSDKDLYEEVNRRQWERMNEKRLEYEAKGKPVTD